VKIPAGTKVRVPLDQQQVFTEYLAKAPPVLATRKRGAGTVSYRISKGDTIYDISRQFQISMDKIIQANQDINPRALRPGQMLDIPQ
jgi:LysM repeat protein